MISARDLTSRLADLLCRERAALAEFDRQRRWVELGHSSLFYFLHRELGLSKGAAFYRKTAAELIQRHVPAHVKRAVWERDGGRCQWKLDGGGVCDTQGRRAPADAPSGEPEKGPGRAIAA
jgi:hypothetical protein